MVEPLATPWMTRAHPAELERAIELTVPGMADFADIETLNKCGSCFYWNKRNEKFGSCNLYAQRMRGKRVTLTPSQRACRQWISAKEKVR